MQLYQHISIFDNFKRLFNVFVLEQSYKASKNALVQSFVTRENQYLSIEQTIDDGVLLSFNSSASAFFPLY